MGDLLKNLDQKSCRIGFRLPKLTEKEILKISKKNKIALSKVLLACVEEGLNHSSELGEIKITDESNLGETLIINVSKVFLDKIDLAAKKLNVKRAELLRRALVVGLKSA